MAITPVGAASNPADNGVLDDSVPRAVVPPGGMVAGDLVYVFMHHRNSSGTPITNSDAGGQTWNALTQQVIASGAGARAFWCRFNGTWSSNPAFTVGTPSGAALTVILTVFRPTTGTNTWAVDVVQDSADLGVPSTPFDMTAPGQTTIANNTVTLAVLASNDDNTWAIQSGGWSNPGGIAQWRNTQGSDISQSIAYKIQTVAGGTGTLTNRQLTNGGDAGRYFVTTFKEQTTGVTVSNADDEVFHNGETGVVITGAGFGASQGAGFVKISPTNNIADGAAVTQAISAWANTSITLGALSLGSFDYFTNLYLFVQNNAGASNSSGWVIQREAWAAISATLEDLAGNPQLNLSNVRYRVCAGTLVGAELLANTNGTTNGSGVVSLPTIVLTSGGALAPGADVWVSAAVDGASQALSFATCVKVTPTYT